MAHTLPGVTENTFANGKRGCWWMIAKSEAGDFTGSQSEGLRLLALNPKGWSERRNYHNFEQV